MTGHQHIESQYDCSINIFSRGHVTVGSKDQQLRVRLIDFHSFIYKYINASVSLNDFKLLVLNCINLIFHPKVTLHKLSGEEAGKSG